MLSKPRKPAGERWLVPCCLVPCLLVLCTLFSVPAVFAASPAERFRDAVAAATAQQVPAAEAVRLDAKSRRLGETGSRRAESPVLEAQSEGLGEGRQRNAADSLRWQQEFSWPGQRRALGDFVQAAAVAEQLESGAGVAGLRLEAGRSWLELAALADERLVLEQRAARLMRAVALHEKRFELGEVAGAEVTQLELQQARDGVERQRLEARAAVLETELTRLTGDAPRPVAGDLEVLLAGLGPVGAATGGGAGDPWLAAAEAEQARAEHLARLDAALAAGRPAGELEVQRVPSLDGAESFESFSLQLSVPLAWGSAVTERRAAAEARAELARAASALERRRSRARLDLVLAELRAAEASLASLSGLLAELPRTERSLAEQFRLGAISYLVYLDGLDRLDHLRIDAAYVRGTAARARFELSVLTGDHSVWPSPSHNVTPEHDLP